MLRTEGIVPTCFSMSINQGGEIKTKIKCAIRVTMRESTAIAFSPSHAKLGPLPTSFYTVSDIPTIVQSQPPL